MDNYAILICSYRRPEMFSKTISKLVKKYGADPSRIICGIHPDDEETYIKECKQKDLSDIRFIKIRKIGIGSAREAVRKYALKLFPKVKYFVWIDDKTSVHKGFWRGRKILAENKSFGIVCGVSSICSFFMGKNRNKKGKQKPQGCTLMWVRKEVLKTSKFCSSRCYEDTIFMLEAIKRGWKIVNDYKSEFSGQRHLKGGTLSHKGMRLEHVKYALRVILKSYKDMIKGNPEIRFKQKDTYMIVFKFTDKVLNSVLPYGA